MRVFGPAQAALSLAPGPDGKSAHGCEGASPAAQPIRIADSYLFTTNSISRRRPPNAMSEVSAAPTNANFFSKVLGSERITPVQKKQVATMDVPHMIASA